MVIDQKFSEKLKESLNYLEVNSLEIIPGLAQICRRSIERGKMFCERLPLKKRVMRVGEDNSPQM